MKSVLLLIIIGPIFSIQNLQAAEKHNVVYTSPSANSILVTLQTNIIIGFDKIFSGNHDNIFIEVVGSKSNNVEGKMLIFPHEKKLIFDPDNNFKENESVTVKLSEKISANKKILLKKFVFHTIEKLISAEDSKKIIRDLFKELYRQADRESVTYRGDTIPENFPNLVVNSNSNPAPGKIYCSNIPRFTRDPFLMILDNNGNPEFYRSMPEDCYDFKIHPNGLMTYFQNFADKYYALNSDYNLVDSFYTGNGYITDQHELRFKENGNVLLMSYDPQFVDMSLIVPGGQKNATVIGLIIQEVDTDNNVLFQWRSWDHFNILDADRVNLTSGIVDYAHGNAIEIDYDGHYLVSSRNMSEITKIHSQTGEMIWRFGGKNNQFNFVNDTLKFYYQHAIRRTSTGTYTLYDNGNWHTPKFSRAVEYRLNESARTAELVWEFRHDPIIYSFAMGYVERLPNGNTTISWGFSPVSFTEVNMNKEVVYEMSFDSSNVAYRIIRSDLANTNNQGIPPDYVIISSYPNPFNGSANIVFSLPQNSNVTLHLYNTLGEKIRTLISDQFYESGSHTVRVNAGGLISGVYFYNLFVNGNSYDGKMVLVK